MAGITKSDAPQGHPVWPGSPRRPGVRAGLGALLLALASLGLGACARYAGGTTHPPESARSFVTAFEHQLAPHVRDDEHRWVAKASRAALSRPDVQWVIVQDGDGQVVAEAVRDGLDPAAIRRHIGRLAWQPAKEQWTRCPLPALGSAFNLSRPLSGDSKAGADASPGRPRLGTIHVGFGTFDPSSWTHRIAGRIESMTGEWNSPFRKHLTTRSQQALIYYRAGVHAIRKFYDGEARTAWLMALEEDPHFAMAMVRLGRQAHELGDAEAAMAWCRRAQAEESRLTPREKLEIRCLHADLEDREVDERAIEAELVRRFADDAEILIISGNQHLNEGRPEMALIDLEKAGRIDPDEPGLWNLVGYAQADLGRWPEAEDAFERYAFINGDQANPHDSLGEFYLRTGHYRKALRQFETATEIKPDFSWAHYHLSLVNAELGRWEAAFFAIQRAREAARQNPEDRWWSRTDVMLNLRAGRTGEAARRLAAHCREYAVHPAELALMVRVSLASGDLTAARAALRNLTAAIQAPGGAAHDPPSASESHLVPEMQGLLHRAEGKPAEAVERLDAALVVARTWVIRQRIERETIETLVESGRRDEALRRLEPILARNPEDPTANWWFGRALELDGRREEARAAFDRARRALDGADDDDPLTVTVREACRTAGG